MVYRRIEEERCLSARYKAVLQGPVFHLIMCSTRISSACFFLVFLYGTDLALFLRNWKKFRFKLNTSLPASIYNLDTRLLMNHQSLCLAVFLKPGKAIFSLITQHNNTNQIQPSLHPAETDNTEII